MKEYDTFVDSTNNLEEGNEIDIVVRDLSPGRYKYEMKRVRAVVSKSPDSISSPDRLLLRYPMGELYSDPWYIKVISELED